MYGFLKNILKVSLSNIVSLFSGVLVGFIVPKMMGLEGYADYKIYTLYLTYLAFFSLGIGDGIYLTFSGMDKSSLDKNLIHYYLKKYYFQIGIFSVIALILSSCMVQSEYRFILIALALTIFSSQLVGLYQNISLLTASFNEYSIRVIIKAVLTSLFVIFLYVISIITKVEISYRLYVGGIVAIDYILAIWYALTYKEYIVGKFENPHKIEPAYRTLSFIGFPLLLSNMAGTIFLNLDRQFVSVLFQRTDYAVYAFAYNMLTLVTTMTSAVSLVLFPSLKKQRDLSIAESLEAYLGPFNIVVAIFLLVYYPLSWFIPFFLPKYVESLEVFRVVLPGLVISTSVSVILINYYKLDNQVKRYFIITIIAMAFSAVANWFAYNCFHTYISISWASIVSLLVWYLLAIYYFVKKYKIKIVKNTLYMILVCTGFYVITQLMGSSILSSVIFIVFYMGLSFLLYGKVLQFFLKRKK